jgi:beta-N-acetylhexosaminidase
MSCAKHFPGHGSTVDDSHFVLPVVNKTMSELMEWDLIPFRVAIKHDVPFIMTAHILYPKIDSRYPATFSKIFLDDILRKKFEYKKIIMSDDLDMGAVAKNYDFEECLPSGFNAGLDMICACKDRDRQAQVYHHIEQGLKTKTIDHREFEKSLERIYNVTCEYSIGKLPPLSLKSIGTLQHQTIVDTINARINALLG